MKKNLFTSMLVLTIATAVINPVFSQDNFNDFAYNSKNTVIPTVDVETAAINTKAVRDLHKNFSVTEDLKWYKKQNGYTAEFMIDGTKHRVDYDKKGNWDGTLRTYAEDKLAKGIRTMVKSVYFDYNIKWVWEISVPGLMDGPCYIVHIEDEKGFKNLQVQNGEMKVLEHYEKSIGEN